MSILSSRPPLSSITLRNLTLSLSLSHPSQLPPHPQQARTQIQTIRRHRRPKPPPPAAKEHNQNHRPPRHPDDIKHVLRQALGGHVLAGVLERLGGGVILGAAGPLEDVFADEGWCRDERIGEEGAGAEEKVREEEEEVDGEGGDVEVVEGGGVGFCEVFFCFLGHFKFPAACIPRYVLYFGGTMDLIGIVVVVLLWCVVVM